MLKQTGGEDRASKASAHAPITASRADELAGGDRVLLWPDGPSDFVRDTEIEEALVSSPLDTTCGALVPLALDRGGRDTITVVGAEVEANALHHRAGRVA